MTKISSIAWAFTRLAFYWLPQCRGLPRVPVHVVSPISCMYVLVGTCGLFSRSNRSHSSRFLYYLILVLAKGSDAAALYHTFVIEVITMAMERFFLDAVWGAVGFHCCDPRVGPSDCWLRLALVTAIWCIIAPRESLGCLWKVACWFRTSLVTVMGRTWLKQ